MSMSEGRGKKIGHYEVDAAAIGHGSFAKVKRCVDLNTQGEYAVKIMDKELLVKEKMEAQLFREVAIMKRLDHRHIVKMREVMQSTRYIYIFMELMHGGSLQERIQECDGHGLPEEQVRDYFQQLIVGLSCCHHQGIAHRDLKPENLLLDRHGTLKIADFGFANLQRPSSTSAGEHSLMSTICGTIAYTAPEVLSESPYNGLIADVWSCGVVLYVMTTGRLPFSNKNIQALYLSIERASYQTPTHVSPELVDLIRRLLTADPAQRATLAEVARHPWFSPGFDASRLLCPVITVNDEDVAAAITQEEGGPIREEEHPLDAMELIEFMLQASFSPLVRGQDGMAHGQARRFIMYRGTAAEAVADVTAALETLNANPRAKTTHVKGFTTSKNGVLTFMVYMTRSVCGTLTLVGLHSGRGHRDDFEALVTNLRTALEAKSCSVPIALP